MMTSSSLRVHAFKWLHILWYTDSPDVGDPNCVCSYAPCRQPISEPEFALRLFRKESPASETVEARFHIRCWNKVSPDKFDLHLKDTDDYPEDVP